MNSLSGQNQKALDSRGPLNARMRGLDASIPFAEFRLFAVLLDRAGLAIHNPEMDVSNDL